MKAREIQNLRAQDCYSTIAAQYREILTNSNLDATKAYVCESEGAHISKAVSLMSCETDAMPSGGCMALVASLRVAYHTFCSTKTERNLDIVSIL